MTRPLRLFAYGLGAVVCALVLLAAGERALWRGKVLPGVRLAGMSVGGQSLDAARRTINARAAGLEHDSVDAVAGDIAFTFTPGEVGLELDEAGAYDEVRWAGRRGNLLAQTVGVVARRLSPMELAWEVTYDERRLARAVDAWAERVDSPPADGSLRIEGGVASPQPPRPGRVLLRDDTRRLVNRALHGREAAPVRLPVQSLDPEIGTDDVERALADAQRVLAGPAVIGLEGRAVTLSPAQLGKLLSVAASGGNLAVELPDEAVRRALAEVLAGLEFPARDARFVIDNETPRAAEPDGSATAAPSPDGSPPTTATLPFPPPSPPPAPVVRIEESAQGRALDVHPVAQALLAGERHIDAKLIDVAPAVDTERARALRIIEPVASFTTSHPAGQPRVKNIHRIADIVQDTVILPGQRFSLNQKVGPRTRARGFVKAPVIYEGEFTEDIGGGVSQYATTFFNAAFFGGYRIVAHKPHTFYISRYPKGREATVSFPQPDLVIENDSTTGILVRNTYTGSSITVTFWGDKEGRTVRAEGPRVGKKSAKGYNVEVVRVIERAGRGPERQSFNTYYRLQPTKPRAPKPAAPAPAAPAPAEPVAPPPG